MKLKRHGPDSVDSWIVCAMCGLIYFVMYGLARLCGMLFVFSMERFHSNREKASFPFVLCDFVQTTVGPVAGFLAPKIGIRWVVTLGCVLVSIGTGACFLAEDILTVTILWGLVYGSGFGLSSLIVPAICNQYFIELRATALGLCNMGAYVGMAILPLLFDLFNQTYGLSGTFLLIGGLAMNCIPMALLLKDQNFTDKKFNAENVKKSINSGDLIPKTPESCKNLTQIVHNKSKLYSIDTECSNNGTRCKTNSDFSLEDGTRTYAQKNCHISGCNKCLNASNTCTSNPKNSELIICSTVTKRSQTGLFSEANCENILNDDVICSQRQPIFINITADSSKEASKTSQDLSANILVNSSESKSHRYSFRERIFSRNNSIRNESTLWVYLDPAFILIVLADSAYGFSYIAYMAIIVDFSRDVEVYTDNGKYLLLCISVVGIVTSASMGWIKDKSGMKSHNFSILCLLLTALVNGIMPWARTTTVLVVLVGAWSLPGACLAFLVPLLINDYIPEDKQAMAISSSYFLTGPLYLTISPLVGFFRDGFGSYDYIFYLLSLLLALNCITLFFVPHVSRKRK